MMTQPEPEPVFNTYLSLEWCNVYLLKNGSLEIVKSGDSTPVTDFSPEEALQIYQLLHARFKTKPSTVLYRNL